MARAKGAAGLDVTIPERSMEFLVYLTKIRKTNLGRTPTGVATSIVEMELAKMMKKDPFALYWRQGLPPFPPMPTPQSDAPSE